MSNDRAVALPQAGGWEETRAQTALATQFVANADDYLAAAKQDVGRLTSADTRELFVSCDPAQALRQQFEHLAPDFIAVHDLATTSSRKLLSGVAAASGRPVQRLVIRRQGYGTALASLQFVELPTRQGPLLRMYATEAEADTAVRHAIAHVLLAFSRLGAVMVGDLPPHAMEPALRPLGEATAAGPWPNRHLLLLPLAAASTLVAHGMALGRGCGVSVRTTPQVTRPADAWRFISASWSRLGDAPGEPNGPPPAAGAAPASRAPAPRAGRPAASLPAPHPGGNPAPVDMRPMPAVPAATPASATAPPDVLERYLQQLGAVVGMLGCCLFDVATSRQVAQAGTGPTAAQLASQGAQLLGAMASTSRALGFGRALPDAAITLGDHHLLLRAVPNHPGLALHAVLDKTRANLTLARLQIERMDVLFAETASA